MLAEPLDPYLPEVARTRIEEQYYAQVNRQASLEALLEAPDFLRSPTTHPGLFADHGIVHVRDVAQQVLRLLRNVSGVLIPTRSDERQAFAASYGVMLAYVHDIGMADFTPFGRVMHPEVAAQIVFSPAFDAVVAAILADDTNAVVARLRSLTTRGAADLDTDVMLREMLALSVGHSKSKMPVDVLNDPQRLRALMLRIIGTDLRLLYSLGKTEKARQALARADADGISPQGLARMRKTLAEAEANLADNTARYGASSRQADVLGRYYVNVEHEAFAWLVADAPASRELVDDVVDTIRVLRAADALRQRGTVLKTSGSYEIYVDQTTADAIYALRSIKGELFMLTAPDPLAAGEANIASSEITLDGNLRISFHRGAFVTPEIARRAATYTGTVIVDIQLDAIQSFMRPARVGARPSLKTAEDMLILLEETDDNLAFSDMVAALVCERVPELRGRVQVVPSLEHMPSLERVRYLTATDFRGTAAARQAILDHVGQSGHNTQAMDVTTAFAHVKVMQLQRGEILLEGGSPPGFVYIPMSYGLRVYPLGGYESTAVPAWTPVGNTGVIRGAARNATVVADDTVALLVIPRSIYLKHWHYPYTSAELVGRLKDEKQ